MRKKIKQKKKRKEKGKIFGFFLEKLYSLLMV